MLHLRKTCRLGCPCAILLIEDDQPVANMIKLASSQFEPGCFEITHCTSISEARALCPTRQFALIVLDLGLARSTGLNSLNEVRAFVDENIPIAIFTGEDDEETELLCFESGAIAYVSKPVLDWHQFLRRCRGWVVKHQRDILEMKQLIEENQLLKQAAEKITDGKAKTEVTRVAETLFGLAESIRLRYKGQVAPTS